MIDAFQPNAEMELLLAAAIDGRLSGEDQGRIEQLLRDDLGARECYVDHVILHAMLRWEHTPPPSDVGGEELEIPQMGDEELEAETRSEASTGPSRTAAPSRGPLPVVVVPPLSSPELPRFPLGGMLFSYAAAATIVAVALLAAWVYRISHDAPVVRETPREGCKIVASGPEYVGCITGMADVKWSDNGESTPSLGTAVQLGRKYNLDAGLLEITYKTGGKVILQGPCVFEAESCRGGFLSLGRLTALVEKRGKGQGGGGDAHSDRRAAVGDQHSPNPRPQHPAPLFTVRTPTAVVADLGTEFGVEVDKRGTMSYVFRGAVRMQSLGSDDRGQADVVLQEKESARVGKDSAGNGPERVRHGAEANASRFARRIVESPKVVDLLDIVAGGNGAGLRRERGIDPTAGDVDVSFPSKWRDGDRQYHRVTWQPAIDGVFIPDGRDGPVQVDSVGHKFKEFPPTCGITWGGIWARAAKVSDDAYAKRESCWVHAMGDVPQYMPSHRGLLGLHSNTGISFDLNAVRRRYPSAMPTRFHSVLGMGDMRNLSTQIDGIADVWVLVDGRLKFKRSAVHPMDAAIEVSVELGPNDRFLTLVTTDGVGAKKKYLGNWETVVGDWVVFGDPVLQMTKKRPVTESNATKDHASAANAAVPAEFSAVERHVGRAGPNKK